LSSQPAPAPRPAPTPARVRVAGYARFSTTKQEKGVSIETQDSDMRETCSRRGWAYVGTYADRAFSGAASVDQRPELARLLKDAAKGAFDKVMAMDASRLARDQEIFWQVVGRLKRMNVVFLTSVMPDIDSTMPEFQMIAGSLQGASAYERLMTSKKTTLAARVKKAQGKYWGRVPKGFEVGEDGLLHPDALGRKAIGILQMDGRASLAELKQELQLKDLNQAYRVKTSVAQYLKRDHAAGTS
jgi:DNA invertase Pin-like site-specific DNA recombinase